ncbi:AAA family ATPase [Limnospira fusiformis KN01]|uniref:AAA family ATPase n=1 Tax=Limnospira TaxID=2596745 RepID=UPI0016589417|nr:MULTISPECIES: AAA family ATPase [Limnospira]MDT9197517.1 AAA family ATPase [Limnospira sp. PMC 1042.18]ULB46465.1 AAA family ATPase [Limnospira fusiformis KN01]
MVSQFIHSLKLRNLLSYGSDTEPLKLEPLNVLIGRNASGKSNLIEALGILKATPTDLTTPIRQGGGISDFLWKGTQKIPIAEIDATIAPLEGSMNLRYRISFTETGQRLEIIDEAIENEQPYPGENEPYFFYRYQEGRPVINEATEVDGYKKRALRRETLSPEQSVLSQRKDPDMYPQLSYLAAQFAQINLYRNWQIGRYSEPRLAQQTDLPSHPILEDISNLGLVLNNLQYQLGSREIIENLQKFYEEAEELIIKIYGGTVQIFIREKDLIQPIPATRLSDGTLRYLFLMALLLDPTPGPILCIEEPEIGLHPDILPMIAEMLISASERTQLIVTTHSDALISALPPESVLVCDRHESGSFIRRLEADKLKKWLENYTLGDLWRMGEIGGNRW